MKPWSPAASPLTWALAVVLLVGLDAAIAHTSLLWGPSAFEHRAGAEMLFGRSFQVARTIYGPRERAEFSVALLGNSRLAYALQEETLLRVLAAAGHPDARVDHLAMFGACPAMLEVLSRHLEDLDPTAAVLAINASDLQLECDSGGHATATRPFDLDGSEAPGAAPSLGERVDRWLRTHWRLWRYRAYARARIEDLLLGSEDPGSSLCEDSSVLDALHGIFADGSVEGERAYRVWQARPSLGNFIDYLKIAQPLHLKMARNRAARSPDPVAEAQNLAILEHILTRMAKNSATALVLIMPENPILGRDHRQKLHRSGESDRGVALIRALAERHGIDVVDARSWRPAEVYLDLTHLRPDDKLFEQMLARALLDRLGS